MSEFKYIIIQYGPYEYPIIFPDKLVHEDMARAVLSQEQFNRSPECMAIVVAAGFIDLECISGLYYEKAIDVHRSSESLGIGPRKDDYALISNFRYGHGIAATVYDAPNHFSPRFSLPCYNENKPGKARGSKSLL